MSHQYRIINKDYYKNLEIYKNWNQDIGEKIASQELIIMTDKHWEIIYLIRKFYLTFNRTPSMRMLVLYMKKKIGKKRNSFYLFKLFPKNPINIASKIAGVPKPNTCF